MSTLGYPLEQDRPEDWSRDIAPVVAAMKDQTDNRQYWDWGRIHVDLSSKDSDLTDYGYRGIEIVSADETGLEVTLHAMWTGHHPDCTDDDCTDEHCESEELFARSRHYPWALTADGMRVDDEATAAAILDTIETLLDGEPL